MNVVESVARRARLTTPVRHGVRSRSCPFLIASARRKVMSEFSVYFFAEKRGIPAPVRGK
jgi:hypothetical protein